MAQVRGSRVLERWVGDPESSLTLAPLEGASPRDAEYWKGEWPGPTSRNHELPVVRS